MLKLLKYQAKIYCGKPKSSAMALGSVFADMYACAILLIESLKFYSSSKTELLQKAVDLQQGR